MFGQRAIEVNGVEHISGVIHAIKPNVPLLLEDFHWTTTTNGSVVPVSCVTGLLEQSNSNGKKEIMGRSGKNPYVPLKIIKQGSTNSLSFEAWYSAPIPEEHMRAIEKHNNLFFRHFFQIAGGPMVDLCPLMTPSKASRVEFKVNTRRSRGLTLNEDEAGFAEAATSSPQIETFQAHQTRHSLASMSRRGVQS